jgi:hypothetical protein
VAGSCEYGNEPTGSIKGWEFLDWPGDYWVFEADSAPKSRSVGWLVG